MITAPSRAVWRPSHAIVEVTAVEVRASDGAPRAICTSIWMATGGPPLVNANAPAEQLRPLITAEQAERVLVALTAPVAPVTSVWTADRAEACFQAGKNWDVDTMCGAARELAGTKMTRQLTHAEKQYVRMFIERLTREISIVLAVDIEVLRARIAGTVSTA